MTDADNRPPDPLARHQVVPSGPHTRRIALAAGTAVGLGLLLYMAGGRDETPASTARLEVAPLPPPGPSYADLAPRPVPPPPPDPAPPTPRVALPAPAPEPRPQPRAAAPEDELRKKALDAGVGGWSRKEEARTAGSSGSFQPPSGACVVPPGTPIHAQTVTRTVTERGGILVARVTRDLLCPDLAAVAVPAGSTLTMTYASAASRSQTRIEIANPVVTRPWPLNDTVELDAMTADATGEAGLPGAVDIPWFRTGLLIAASAAIDLGTAALSGGGSLIGGLLGRSLESPLDRATRDLLERAPVITLEAGKPVVVILRGALKVSLIGAPLIFRRLTFFATSARTHM